MNIGHLCTSEIPDDDPEIKKEATTFVMATSKNDTRNIMCKRSEKLSLWKRLKKAIAWIVNYKQRLREVVRRHKDSERVESRGQQRNKVDPITVEELDYAGRLVLEIVQRSHFQDELNALKTRFDVESLTKTKGRINKASTVYKVNPEMVETG